MTGEQRSMRFFFVRHGQSEANLLHEFSNKGMKHLLSGQGLSQALQLAAKLKHCAITRIYSSPVLRAIHTTQIVAETLGIPSFEVNEALREYDVGLLEGKSDQESWALFENLQKRWEDPRNCNEKIEGGESFSDIQKRFSAFVTDVLYTHDAGDNVLCVTHGGLLRIGLPAVLQNVDYSFAREHGLDNCDIVVAASKEKCIECLKWGSLELKPE